MRRLASDFWEARFLLRQLHDVSLARRLSPDALMAGALTYHSVRVPARLVIPPVQVSDGHRGLFVALAGVSALRARRRQGPSAAGGSAAVPAAGVARFSSPGRRLAATSGFGRIRRELVGKARGDVLARAPAARRDAGLLPRRRTRRIDPLASPRHPPTAWLRSGGVLRSRRTTVGRHDAVCVQSHNPGYASGEFAVDSARVIPLDHGHSATSKSGSPPACSESRNVQARCCSASSVSGARRREA